METNIKFIYGSFEITGDFVNRFINCSFIVTNEPNNLVLSPVVKVYGQSGIITENYNIPVPHAIVIVRKNSYIYDKTVTDINGNYHLFLPSGIYDIEIQSQLFNRTIKNHEVKLEEGITEVKVDVISGDIFEKSEDSVLFTYDDGMNVNYDSKSLVHGQILDIKDKPVYGAEIVVNETDTANVIAYVKTDLEGKYKFVLPHAHYDVRIRLPKQHVKIAKDVDYVGIGGFIPKVSEKLNK